MLRIPFASVRANEADLKSDGLANSNGDEIRILCRDNNDDTGHTIIGLIVNGKHNQVFTATKDGVYADSQTIRCAHPDTIRGMRQIFTELEWPIHSLTVDEFRGYSLDLKDYPYHGGILSVGNVALIAYSPLEPEICFHIDSDIQDAPDCWELEELRLLFDEDWDVEGSDFEYEMGLTEEELRLSETERDSLIRTKYTENQPVIRNVIRYDPTSVSGEEHVGNLVKIIFLAESIMCRKRLLTPSPFQFLCQINSRAEKWIKHRNLPFDEFCKLLWKDIEKVCSTGEWLNDHNNYYG